MWQIERVDKPPQDTPEDLPDAGGDGYAPPPADTAEDTLLVRRQPFWKRIGGDGLVVSLVIHLALLILFAAWVVSSWTDSNKTDPDTFATGAGGGAAGDKAKIYEHKLQPKNARNLAKNSARITTKSASSTIALPDLPATATPSLTTGLSGGGSSKGFGGGSGGGIGSGKGVGVGNGRNFVGLFGAKFGGAGLVGTFYDLKQDKDRGANAMMGPDPANYNEANRPAVVLYVKAVNAFIEGRFDESKLRKYYQAPDKLVATQFFIPKRKAEEAPKAYGVLEQVKPSRWIAHYKGRVKAPVTGKFRFVGFADDLMVVRWDGKVALDAGYDGPSIDASPTTHYTDPVRTYDDFTGKPKVPLYDYHGTLPGDADAKLRAGPWIDVVAGSTYAMEVVIGETPGGRFGCILGIEVSTGQRKNNEYQGDRAIRLFKIGVDELPAEIADGAGTGWQMNPGDWTFQAAGAGGAPR